LWAFGQRKAVSGFVDNHPISELGRARLYFRRQLSEIPNFRLVFECQDVSFEDGRNMDYSKLLSGLRSSQPLYGQLRDSLERAIESGALLTGARLPSERELATRLGVSRTTVINAYRELESMGLVRGYVGRGTFVCATPEPGDSPFAWRGKISASAAHLDTTLAPGGLLRRLRSVKNPRLISFAIGAPALECFPIKEYRRLMDRALNRHADEVLGLAPTEGQSCLRQAIAERFEMKRERILILSGAQQGLNLIARCLLDSGDTVIVERPGYVGAIQTFRTAGANLIGWDRGRSDLDELEDLIIRYRPKLLHTNPTFQNPTGAVLPLRERQELLKLAARYRLPVIENDPYREIYLDSQPPPSLYELDGGKMVIHLSTFSKILAPGLRLGWLAGSEYLVERLSAIKQRDNVFTESLGQLVMASFLRSGLIEDHLARLRVEHRRRRDEMARALEQYLPGRMISFARPRGGLYLWCRFKDRIDSRQFLQRAMREGVAFAPGNIFYSDGAGNREFRLCFSGSTVEKIDEGVRLLAKCLRYEGSAANIE
jgi:2-aminoadipate transaminase